MNVNHCGLRLLLFFGFCVGGICAGPCLGDAAPDPPPSTTTGGASRSADREAGRSPQPEPKAPAPAQAPSSPSPGTLQQGGRFYRLNCAPCHGATALGGSLVFARNAPSLMGVPPAAIPGFVRLGLGPMPAFKKEIFSDQDVSAIAAYVATLQSPEHPGGYALGFVGPVTEGFLAIVLGLGAAVLAARFIEVRGRG